MDLKRQLQVLSLENACLTETYHRTHAELAEIEATGGVAPKIELPEAAELLNQLKAKRKNSKVTLADVEAILELLDL